METVEDRVRVDWFVASLFLPQGFLAHQAGTKESFDLPSVVNGFFDALPFFFARRYRT